MAIAAIDANKLIRQYLTAESTDLYTEVGTRVAVLRKSASWTNSQKCIVFSIRGGETNPQDTIKTISVQFLCFGGSELVQDAMQVARALEDRLNGAQMQSVSEGVLMGALMEVEPQPIVDPDTKEVYVFTAYEIECRGA